MSQEMRRSPPSQHPWRLRHRLFILFGAWSAANFGWAAPAALPIFSRCLRHRSAASAKLIFTTLQFGVKTPPAQGRNLRKRRGGGFYSDMGKFLKTQFWPLMGYLTPKKSAFLESLDSELARSLSRKFFSAVLR